MTIMRQRVMDRQKFVNIAVTSDTLYALDVQGHVWRYEASMNRGGAPAAWVKMETDREEDVNHPGAVPYSPPHGTFPMQYGAPGGSMVHGGGVMSQPQPYVQQVIPPPVPSVSQTAGQVLGPVAVAQRIAPAPVQATNVPVRGTGLICKREGCGKQVTRKDSAYCEFCLAEVANGASAPNGSEGAQP
jgi:hypothetical protein